MLDHQSITCPYCWQTVEIVLDLSVPTQTYTEDCAVCCRPIVISYRADEGEITELDARPEMD